MAARSLPLGLTLAVLGLVGLGALGSCPASPRIEQGVFLSEGFAEPNTPGAVGGPPLDHKLRAILGPNGSLNRIETVRTRMAPGTAEPPRTILILIPGFLGGAGTFDPIARDLAVAMGPELAIWAVDRRTSNLEDRRGAWRTRRLVERAIEEGDPDAARRSLEEGVRFYFGPIDLDDDGVPEPPFEQADENQEQTAFQHFAQDEVRFMAHWGVDTYVRDWRALVDEARERVGPGGRVVLGGHSLGTTWAGVFAAYDFDPGPGVDAGYEHLDGLLLLEGGGPRAPRSDAPDLAAYDAAVADMASPGGADVYLSDLFGFGIPPIELGAAGELSGIAGTWLPDDPAILKKTTLFGGVPIGLFFLADMTNRALPGFFLDDDFSANAAFSVSIGFSDDGDNARSAFGNYVAIPGPTLRTWKNAGDPTLPTCPPLDPVPSQPGDTGCAIVDNGPKPGPGDPRTVWGVEREVTDMDVLLRTLFETANASEWYFGQRPSLDLGFGRDSSALGAPDRLNVTQNASMDVPVLGIGGSNGLAVTEESFADYLGSIATPPEDQTVVILEGYSHVDPLSATDNEAVPVIVDWLRGL